MRFLPVVALVLLNAGPARACWGAIDPSGYADECPIIVRGQIVAVIQAEPGQDRADDLARIRVAEIQRNELKDVPLKVGDLFTVRMISKNNRLRTSTDLNYPVATDALWLIKLTAKGEFRIDLHPVQKQPVEAKLRLALGERKAGKKGEPEEPAGRLTKQQWIAEVRAQAERSARDREKRAATERDIRTLAKDLATADDLKDMLITRFSKASLDVRRDVFQLRGHEQPLEGDRLVAVVELVLQTEPDENVRVFAANALGYAEKPGKRAGAVLGAALTDPSRDVRLFACQAIKHREAKDQAAKVAALLDDQDAQVRDMARETLVVLGAVKK
jgi:hypothetical protein